MRRLGIILVGLAALALLLAPATGQAAGPARQTAQTTTTADLSGTQGATTSTAAGASATTGARQLTDLESSGRALYLDQCASCHGVDLGGATGGGPSLRNVGGGAAVDWVLRTGRMPLPAIDAKPKRGPSRYDAEQIRALVAYVGNQVGDTDLPNVQTTDDPEELRHGRELYMENCSACHGVNGAGAAIGGGFDAPPLYPVLGTDVGEAMKIGPGRMPVFAGDQYPTQDVDAIASYVLTLGNGSQDRGGSPIGGRGPVAEGFVAWVVGLGLIVFAVRLIGTRTPRPASEDEPEPETDDRPAAKTK